MLEELDTLIVFIQKEYDELINRWKKSDLYSSFNQKITLVKDINQDNNILKQILNYRNFINENNLYLKMRFEGLSLKSKFNTRVKAQNSIEDKVENYMTDKHENGAVPINKSFNDIFGVRIIFDEDVDYSIINNFIEKKYNKKYIKCTDSSKNTGYVATHVYFRRDNYNFQWELQIWDKKHEKVNVESHEKYKQEYAKWEKENK